MTIELLGPHADRPTSFLEHWDVGGWRIKVYTVAFDRAEARPELVAEAKRLAEESLPQPADGEGRYGVGFVVVHDGRGGNWVLIDWWANDNELNQMLYASTDAVPLEFQLVTSGLVACVHELKVVTHEYRAWLDAILANASGPSLERYLAATAL